MLFMYLNALNIKTRALKILLISLKWHNCYLFKITLQSYESDFMYNITINFYIFLEQN